MTQEFHYNTLKLKLNRLKLKHSYSEQTGSLTLGGNVNLTRAWIVWFLLPLSLTLSIFLLIKLEILPTFDRGRGITSFYGVFGGVLATFALGGFARIILLIKQNKGEKIFSKGKILIKNKKGQQIEILTSQIKEFDYTITFDQLASIGELFVIEHNGQKHSLLGIQAKDAKLLRDDLDYFKSYLYNLVVQN